jgi:hypothetical protein
MLRNRSVEFFSKALKSRAAEASPLFKAPPQHPHPTRGLRRIATQKTKFTFSRQQEHKQTT